MNLHSLWPEDDQPHSFAAAVVGMALVAAAVAVVVFPLLGLSDGPRGAGDPAAALMRHAADSRQVDMRTIGDISVYAVPALLALAIVARTFNLRRILFFLSHDDPDTPPATVVGAQAQVHEPV